MRIYKTIEELNNAKDGICKIFNTKKNLVSDFKKEKDVVNFIVNNIYDFTNLLFNDDVVSFEVDYDLDSMYLFGPRGRRIDLYIVGKKKKYIIEFKNPSAGTESRAAIGQVLDYGREFSDSKKELVIITTKYDTNTAKTIKYYNLPIRYIYLSKKFIAEFLEAENEN